MGLKMGRRYGRNQKRKHRERIAELEAENRTLKDNFRDAKVVAGRLNRDMADLHRALNSITPYSAFLPPKSTSMRFDYLRQNAFRIDRLLELRPVILEGKDPDQLLCIRTLDIPMLQVIAKVEADRDAFQYLIHFQAVSPKGRWRSRYLVSYEMLRRSRDWASVVNRIAESLVEQLMAGLRNPEQALPQPR
jgi:hypothetical protein